MRYTGIGRDSRQRVNVRGTDPACAGSGVSSINSPFATTRRSLGARTVHVTVALSDGWSMLGIQLRARFGQLSPNAVHRPALSVRTISPSFGSPVYRTVTENESPTTLTMGTRTSESVRANVTGFSSTSTLSTLSPM